MLLENLPAGEHIFYRIRFEDFSSPTIRSEPLVGRFRTAPADRLSLTFIWSGDTAGQGWGIDESRGGMRTYATMLRHRPDFFIHSGDNIYADVPIASEQKMPSGEIWRNIVSEEKARPAETLAEFRGNYKYNLLDSNVLAFNREIPIFSQWDDHEVTNNWWPGEPLTRAEHRRKRYVEQNALELASRAARAFREYMPIRCVQAEAGRVYRKISYGPMLDVFVLDMRSYRGPNGEGREETYGPTAYFLGPVQLAWLKARFAQFGCDLEGDRRRYANLACSLSMTLIAIGGSRPSPRAKMGHRAAANWRLPISSPSSSMPASATRSGSPLTCITRRRITMIQTRPLSRTSIRFGNSFLDQSTPALSVPMRLTPRLDRNWSM
jgi:phosphodiesterase/alkaline phosphatase D-like protein